MAKDEDEQPSRGFKVQDRRRFADPDAGASAAEEPPAARPSDDLPVHPEPSSAAAVDAVLGASPGATSASGAFSMQGDDPAAAAAAEASFSEMSFSTFVMGLTTQALMHLGEIPDPVGQTVAHDLPAAKQMIDLLGILRDKTKGNLDAAEEQLLGEVLFDLRMRYVEVARSR